MNPWRSANSTDTCRSTPPSSASVGSARRRSATCGETYGVNSASSSWISRAAVDSALASSREMPSRVTMVSTTDAVDSPRSMAPTSCSRPAAVRWSTRRSVWSRYSPLNAPTDDPDRRYSTRAVRATMTNATSMRTCHSHHEVCQLRPKVTASRASASSTYAAKRASASEDRRSR